MDPELPHPRPDSRSPHAEEAGGTLWSGKDSPRLRERALDVLPLHLREREEYI
jgi:hypothetical protein